MGGTLNRGSQACSSSSDYDNVVLNGLNLRDIQHVYIPQVFGSVRLPVATMRT